MKQHSLILILMIAILFAMPQSVFCSETNLVKNGDFESINNNMPDGWTTDRQNSDARTTFSVRHELAYSNKNYASIANSVENDAWFKQKIDVQANENYKFSAYIKTMHVKKNAKGANLCIIGYDGLSEDITGDTDWTYIEVYIKTGEGVGNLDIAARLGNGSSTNIGLAFFDKISFEKVSSIPDNAKIINVYNAEVMSDTTVQKKENDTVQGSDILRIVIILIIAASILAFIKFRKRNYKS